MHRKNFPKMNGPKFCSETVKLLTHVAGICDREGLINAGNVLRELAAEWTRRIEIHGKRRESGRRDGLRRAAEIAREEQEEYAKEVLAMDKAGRAGQGTCSAHSVLACIRIAERIESEDGHA